MDEKKYKAKNRTVKTTKKSTPTNKSRTPSAPKSAPKKSTNTKNQSTGSKKLGTILAVILTALLVIGAILSVLFAIDRTRIGASTPGEMETDPETRLAEVEAEISEITEEMSEIIRTASSDHYESFAELKTKVAPFDETTAEAGGLKIKDIKVGDGKKIEEETQFGAYYIGWTSDGRIFDSSFGDEGLKAPLFRYANQKWIIGTSLTDVIDGWNEGVSGMKIGGIRQLTIPSELAYGDANQNGIPASSPLRFIIMTIPYNERFGELAIKYNDLSEEQFNLHLQIDASGEQTQPLKQQSEN